MAGTTAKNKDTLDKIPLTFELSGESLERFEALKKHTGTKSTSALIRLLVEKTNFRKLLKPTPEKSAQFSVRLPQDLRSKLTDGAKLKKLSVGAAIREAVATIEFPEGCLTGVRSAPGPRPKAKAAPKAVKTPKKAAAKKATKKATASAPKAVKKEAAVKAKASAAPKAAKKKAAVKPAKAPVKAKKPKGKKAKKAKKA